MLLAELGFENDFLTNWAQRLFAASWQGGLILCLAWLICIAFKNIPAVTRCWIWRIAYAKFLLVLLLGGAIPLPVLPASSQTSVTKAAEPLLNETTVENDRRLLGPQITAPGSANITAESTLLPSPSNPRSNLALITVFGCWILGMAYFAKGAILDCLRAKQLLKNRRQIKDPELLVVYRSLCREMKLFNPPELAMTSEIDSPVLVGSIRPIILLPENVTSICDRGEISLIVAHELAHCKRHDLFWNWIPLLVRTAFFFHPLVWLTQSRVALDQEIACDFLALSYSRVSNQNYGKLLIKVSAETPRNRTPNLATVGVASSFQTLKARITEMSRFGSQETGVLKLLSGAVIVMGLVAITPVTLVAQQEEEKTEVEKVENIRRIENADAPVKVKSRKRRLGGLSKVQDGKSSGTSASAGIQQSPGNVSVSVNDGGSTESIQVKRKDNDTLEVTYTKENDGEKEIKKYMLDNIEQLAKKNKQAYDFYKEHVTANRRRSSSSRADSGVGGFLKNSANSRLPRIQSSRQKPRANQNGNSSSQSSSSSAWESSSSISRNGVTQNFRDSGTTGNGAVGGGNPELMRAQINKMIDKANDPRMKQALRDLLDQIKDK